MMDIAWAHWMQEVELSLKDPLTATTAFQTGIVGGQNICGATAIRCT
jgi:hypothetical protein